MATRHNMIMVVGQDASIARLIESTIGRDEVQVTWSPTGTEALKRLAEDPVEVVVTDLDLPDTDGIALVRELRQRWTEVQSVVIAADASVPRAVAAMKAGAVDFILKPVEPSSITRVLEQVIKRAQLVAELPLPGVLTDGPILVGQSVSLARALGAVRKVAAGTATVVVRGETGTGKELAARMVHDQSPRRQGPFVKVQCSALPDTLLESELFGYERGAFTGANARKPGRVELAQGGTLFLDEIGDIALPMQGKLLRLLQDRQYERLGSNKTVTADVRIVAATFRDLESMVDSGQFRSDLLYRLNVVTIWLPPLRARRADIPELALHFARLYSNAEGVESRQFDPLALETLRAAPWPGNVRQLENLVHRLVILGEGPLISREAVEYELASLASFDTQSALSRSPAKPQSCSTILPLEEEMQRTERKALERALKRSGGNRSRAARLLGISRRTFYNKLAEHNLD